MTKLNVQLIEIKGMHKEIYFYRNVFYVILPVI